MLKTLWLRLVLPLVCVATLALVVHHWWDYDSVLVSLATTLLGVVVTVSFVDWAIRRHESARWTGVDTRIADELERFMNCLVSGVRDSLGFNVDILFFQEEISADPKEMHKRVMQVSQEIVAPSVAVRVGELDSPGWKQLVDHMRRVDREAERIVGMYFSRLRPQQVQLLLDIQSATERAGMLWLTFPDVLGVPVDQLPSERIAQFQGLQLAACESTASAVRNLLDLAAQLDSA